MFYHCERLKYVKYGKIHPVWTDSPDCDLAYKWLGQFCGYSPQIWLSKGDVLITGFKNQKDKYNKNDILFGFDIIKGFPVSYDPWCFVIQAFCGLYDYSPNSKKWEDYEKINKGIRDKFSLEELNKRLELYVERSWEDYFSEDPEEDCSEPWMKDIRTFKKALFQEEDQVVVPSLNLKAAKEIICRNEKQKKALRKMGFIEDRIKIKQMKRFQ
jgi:hypothetical protein